MAPGDALPFAALYETSPNVSAIFEAPTRYAAANRAYRTAASVDAASLASEGLAAVFGASAADEVARSIARVFATGTPDAVVVSPRSEGGRWAITHTPLRAPGEDGVRWVLHQVADLRSVPAAETEAGLTRLFDHAQRASEALAAQRQHLLQLLVSLPGFVCVLQGPTHVVTLANPAFDALVGMREVLGRPLREAVTEAASQGFVALLDDVLRTGTPYSARGVSARVQRRADAPAEDVIVDFVFQPVRLADGTIDGVFVAGHDVTDHHLAVAEAAARERETRFLAEHVPMQVWTADTTGGLTFVNRVTTDFLGAPLSGLGWQAVIHPDDLDATAARWAAALRSGEPYEAEFRLRRHDGEYRWHIARAVPFRAASGDITKWYGCTAEIDDHKQLELQREASIEMLRSRNADLQRFASVLTHDVKAPLRHVANLATWASDDLREGSQASAVEHLDLLAQRARALGELVEGVLRASVGGVDESVELGTIAREAVAMLGARAGMEVEIADGLPTLVGPRVGLKQLMLNLVANAMVHGRDGGWLRIDHDEGADGPRVLVRDRGRGIPPDQRESVWAERSTGATPTAGTGIGLSVVRRLVESRGGRVGVEETPGGGATVWFTWPRASAR